jgi:hypothetical protein
VSYVGVNAKDAIPGLPVMLTGMVTVSPALAVCPPTETIAPVAEAVRASDGIRLMTIARISRIENSFLHVRFIAILLLICLISKVAG